MLRAIVFSKDRPAQLDLFLQGLEHYGNGLFTEIDVLYDCSSPEISNGYFRVQKIHHDSDKFKLNWVSEITGGGFQRTLMELLKVYRGQKFTTFFTDDDIIYRKLPNVVEVERLFGEYPELSCFSLRLGSNTKIQDPYAGTLAPMPREFEISEDKHVVWKWRDVPPYTNFAYPLSVDGHIFKQQQLFRIMDYTLSRKIANPNAFEGTMQNWVRLMPRDMACPALSRVINSPNNRVQEICPNKAGEVHAISAEAANERFIKGERLSLLDMDFSNIQGCHQELELVWK